MSNPEQPTQFTLNVATYFQLVRDLLRALCAPRLPVILGLYVQRMGEARLGDGTVEMARANYRQFLEEQGGVAPEERLLVQMETHCVRFARLQAAWTLCWMVLLPGSYPVYTLVHTLRSPGTWNLLVAVTLPLFVLFFTAVLVVVGFFIQSLLQRPFHWLCARALAIPGVFELPS